MSVQKTHVNIDELLRFRDGTLSSAEIVAVDSHLSTCASCAALAREMFREDARTSLEAAFNLADDELDQRAPAARAWLIAAAVLVVIVLGAVLMQITRREPSPVRAPVVARRSPAPQEARTVTQTTPWDAILAETLRQGRIEPPKELASLRGTPGRLRGNSATPRATLSPEGIVIADERPLLRWSTPLPGPYVVSIFLNDREIVRSPRLDGREWTPPPLTRGKTYDWQVALPNQEVLPAPPAPPAAFHVVDAKSLQSIEDARRTAPDNHLLLGVMYARAGLQGESQRELGTYVEQHPQDTAAKRLLDSVQAW